MQLRDLTEVLDSMSDERLLELIRIRRYNRTVIRPAGKDRQRRAEKKGTQKRVSKVVDLLAGLSAEDKKQLLLDLGG